MPINISDISEKDLEWKELGEKIREVIKTPEEWDQFKTYMNVYYGDDETGPGGTKAGGVI